MKIKLVLLLLLICKSGASQDLQRRISDGGGDSTYSVCHTLQELLKISYGKEQYRASENSVKRIRALISNLQRPNAIRQLALCCLAMESDDKVLECAVDECISRLADCLDQEGEDALFEIKQRYGDGGLGLCLDDALRYRAERIEKLKKPKPIENKQH